MRPHVSVSSLLHPPPPHVSLHGFDTCFNVHFWSVDRTPWALGKGCIKVGAFVCRPYPTAVSVWGADYCIASERKWRIWILEFPLHTVSSLVPWSQISMQEEDIKSKQIALMWGGAACPCGLTPPPPPPPRPTCHPHKQPVTSTCEQYCTFVI
jgi:hypothetical protein